MRQQLDKVIGAMDNKASPHEDSIHEDSIFQAAHKMSIVAIENYEGYLLKSALSMVGAVAQFANDLERLSNEPTAKDL